MPYLRHALLWRVSTPRASCSCGCRTLGRGGMGRACRVLCPPPGSLPVALRCALRVLPLRCRVDDGVSAHAFGVCAS